MEPLISKGSAYLGVEATTFKLRARDLYNNLSATQTVSWAQSATQTVALFSFDNGSGADNLFDSSIGGENELTNNGSVTFSSVGQVSPSFNESAVFNGTNYLSTDHNSTFNGMRDQFTIEMYVKTSVTPGNNNSGAFVLAKKGLAESTGGFKLMLKRRGNVNTTDRKLAFNYVSGGVTNSVQGPIFTLPNNTWAHIAVTYNGGAVNFFVDGVYIGSGSGTAGSLDGTTSDFRIGAPEQGDGANFEGELDDIRLSQVIRYTGSFTPPANPFIGD
jgi:hypothetical protein